MFCLLFGHDLDIHGPPRKLAPVNTVKQVPLMTLPILCNDCFRFLIGQVFDTLLGLQMEFYPDPLVFGVDHAESMAAKSMHVPVRGRNSPVAHDNGHLVQGFRQVAPKIPVVRR